MDEVRTTIPVDDEHTADLVLELLLRLWRGLHPGEADPVLGPSPTAPPAP